MTNPVVEAAVRAMEEKIERLVEKCEKVHIEIKKLTEARLEIEHEISSLEIGIQYLKKGGEVGETTPKCKKCESENVHKDGVKKFKDKDTEQRWKCMNCGHKFTLPLDHFRIPAVPKELDVESREVNVKKTYRTGIRNEFIARIKPLVDSGQSVLIKDVISSKRDSGSMWTAMKTMIEDEPEKYEWFKDVSKRHNPQGIRLKDESKRVKGEKGLFCPNCKTLMLPGENCKKCRA